MPLPSIVFPVVAGLAVLAIVATFLAHTYSRGNEKYSHKSGRSYSPEKTWADTRSENEPRRRKKRKHCPVCLEDIDELEDKGTSIFVAIKCGHVICGDCLQKTLISHCIDGDTIQPRCPVCRTNFTKEDLQRVVW